MGGAGARRASGPYPGQGQRLSGCSPGRHHLLLPPQALLGAPPASWRHIQWWGGQDHTKGSTGCVGEFLVIRACRAGGGSPLQGDRRARVGHRAVLLLPVDMGLLEACSLQASSLHKHTMVLSPSSNTSVPSSQASQQLLDKDIPFWPGMAQGLQDRALCYHC